MSTWGPSKKKSARASAGRRRPASSSRSVVPSRGTTPASRRTGDTTPGPPTEKTGTAANGPARRGSTAAGGSPDGAVGRQHEVAGVVFIGGGLPLYADLAGPLGRGLGTLMGWFVGLGRYAVPVVLVVMGVALIRRGRSAS